MSALSYCQRFLTRVFYRRERELKNCAQMKSRLHMHVVQSDSDKMQLAESSGPQVVNSDLSPVCVANEFEDMNNMEMQARSNSNSNCLLHCSQHVSASQEVPQDTGSINS